MYNNKKIIVIIPSAGSGKRMGKTENKLLIKIGSETVIEKTVDKFENNEWIDEIIIITDDEKIKNICSKYSKVIRFAVGGKQRQDSVYNAIDLITDQNSIVLIHDGARPFVSDEIIKNNIIVASEFGACVTAIKSKDTIKKVKKDSVDETLNRDELINVQTPQSFDYKIIKKAYEFYKETKIETTDDSTMVELLGVKIKVVDGSYNNIKITTKEDIEFANYLEGKSLINLKIGLGYDVHRLIKSRDLIVGGVTIPFEFGLDGHSDGDVLIHAIIDALLGAMNKGDIGMLFPDTDDSYKGVSSLELLKKVNEIIVDNRFKIINIDSVVIAQKPKILPFISEMKGNISKILNIDVSCISIKGTTTEKLGFEGRGEGISAQAIVMVDKK